MVPLTTPATTTGDDEDQMDDDIYCTCSRSHPSVAHTSTSDPIPSSHPATAATSSTTATFLPRQTTSAMNNNLTASPKKISVDNFAPYLVSVRPSGRKRQSKTSPVSNTPTSFSDSSVTILPPLNIHQQQLHHPSNRKSARKTSGRHHTVPVIIASTPTKSLTASSSSKRAHSAANAYEDNTFGLNPSPDMILNVRRHHYHRNSAERRHKSVTNPEKYSRRTQINKIETVRILRARPAFYPVKDKFSAKGGKSMNMNEPLSPITSSGTDIISLDGLPHNILGKHITLMMDRSAMKRKRKSQATATMTTTTATTMTSSSAAAGASSSSVRPFDEL